MLSNCSMDTLKLTLDGKVRTVAKADYIKAKGKQLREFGYNDLTDEHVAAQLEILLEKKKAGATVGMKDGITVIGLLMQKEVS
jgi:hypothetical protein